MRVVLIGGTSHTGKSTVAAAVAARLGFELLSTDSLARHPGRPWPPADLPRHVTEHFRSLTAAELVASVLDHYERVWPRIEELVTRHAARECGGLVLEGSALWPNRVATLTVPHKAMWLTAGEGVLRARILANSGHADSTTAQRVLIEKFLARTVLFQQRLLADLAAAAGQPECIDSRAHERLR